MNTRYMVIDIGSNTVKFTAYEKEGDCIRTIAHRSKTVRFIHYIQDGEVSPEGMERLTETLRSFCDAAEDLQIPPENRYAFATASFRRLKDPARAIAAIRETLSLSVELLSGEEEAALSFAGMLRSLPQAPTPRRGIMFDMGGGSTELSGFIGETRRFSHSNPYGSLSLQEGFLQGEFPTAKEAAALCAYVEKTTRLPADDFHEPDGSLHAYVVGGSAKAIGTLLGIREGFSFTPGEAPLPLAWFEKQLADYLRGEDLAEMKTRYPERYRVLVPALLAYTTLWRRLGVTTVHITGGGMRDGYFHARILKNGEVPS